MLTWNDLSVFPFRFPSSSFNFSNSWFKAIWRSLASLLWISKKGRSSFCFSVQAESSSNRLFRPCSFSFRASVWGSEWGRHTPGGWTWFHESHCPSDPFTGRLWIWRCHVGLGPKGQPEEDCSKMRGFCFQTGLAGLMAFLVLVSLKKIKSVQVPPDSTSTCV